jgi:hypothetical protein
MIAAEIMADHQCFMPRCEQDRDPKWALCGQCFRVLPDDLRYAITRAFSPSMTPETVSPGLQRAINDAQAWVIETFGETPREKYDPGRWERLVRYVRARDEARRARLTAEPPMPEPIRHLRLVP